MMIGKDMARTPASPVFRKNDLVEPEGAAPSVATRILVESVLSGLGLCTGEQDQGSYKWLPMSDPGATSRRYVIEGCGTGNAQRYVLKEYSLDELDPAFLKFQARREHEALLYLSGCHSRLFSVPAPICVLEDPPSVLMGFSDGDNLGALIWNAIRFHHVSLVGRGKLVGLARNIGKVLREMQEITSHRSSSIPSVASTWYLDFLKEQCEEIRRLGFTANRVEGWMRRGEEHIARCFAESDVVFQHTDYYQSNILAGKEGFVLLDFPNAVFGSRYWDISHQYVSLEGYKRFRNVSGRLIDEMKSSFLASFDIDHERFLVFNAFHYLFAFRISLLDTGKGGLRELAARRADRFYPDRIDATLR